MTLLVAGGLEILTKTLRLCEPLNSSVDLMAWLASTWFNLAESETSFFCVCFCVHYCTRSTNMHVHVHVYIHTKMHIETHIHTYTYVHIHIRTHTRTHTHTHTQIHVHVHIHTHTHYFFIANYPYPASFLEPLPAWPVTVSEPIKTEIIFLGLYRTSLCVVFFFHFQKTCEHLSENITDDYKASPGKNINILWIK